MKSFYEWCQIQEQKEIKTYDLEFVRAHYQPFLSRGEMRDFILTQKLTDSSGRIEYNTAKDLAAASWDGWTLTRMNIKEICDWTFPSPYKTPITIPPIVLKTDTGYEVLDGKTRLGYLNFLGVQQVFVYLGHE